MSGRKLTKTYEPNPLLAALYRRFFDRIQVDESWAKEVSRLSERGSVVYVLRSLNFIDFLALDYLTHRHNLPRIRFVNDLGLWILNPLGKGWLNALLPDRAVSAPTSWKTPSPRAGRPRSFSSARPVCWTWRRGPAVGAG